VGEFDLAIEEFKHAYKISNAPGLIFNLAQAMRLRKDWERAIHLYETYLRLDPNSPNRLDVNRFIAECEDELRRASPPRPAPAEAPIVAPPPPAEPPSTLVRRADPETTTRRPPPSKPAPELRAARLSRPSTPWLASGLTTITVGAGLFAGGVAAGVRASDAADQVSRPSREGGDWSARHDALYAEGQRDGAIATVLTVVGGAALVTGAVLTAVGAVKDRRARALRSDGMRRASNGGLEWAVRF
jgi:tetratricopeptide (TPR) repeat protein